MRVITDRPEFAERLLGRAGPWMPVDPGDLDPEDRALATALLDGSRHLAWAEDEEPGWDRLFVAGRATRSQFDALAGLAESGSASGPLLAAAETGDGFHGWGGRPWTAVPGNLHLAALVPIAVPAREGAGALRTVPVLALLDAIDALPELRGRTGVRWVNDIVLEGAKLGGVLLRSWSQGTLLTEALLGLGLDVEQVPEVEPDRYVPQVAALRSFVRADLSCTLAGVARAVLFTLRARLDALCTGHYDALLDDYRRRCTVLGRPVAIHEDAPEGREVARGRVAGITDDLALRLDGREEPVRGGRLIEIQDAANGW